MKEVLGELQYLMAQIPLFIKHAQSTVARVTKQVQEFIRKQPTERFYGAAAVILLVILVFGTVVTALGNALFFEGYAADGAFQLLNPLRRLAEGQVIGTDFQFFHGVGVPLLHYPFYLLFGQGLFAEELARWLVSPLLFWLSAFAVFYVWRKRFLFAFTVATAVAALGMVIIPYLVLPLTSILGVRSVVPVFLLALVLNQKRLDKPVTRKGRRLFGSWTWYELSASVLLAASFLCGTEFGVAAILAFVLARLLYPATKGERWPSRGLSLVRVLGGFMAALFILLAIITRGNPLEPLRYALIEIPTDQIWYFGVPPNKYIHLGNAVELFTTDWRLLPLWGAALVAAVLAWRVHRLRRYRIEVQAFLYAWLAGAFAMVSMLGYYSHSQAGALARMSLLIGALSVVILASQWQKAVPLGLELGRLKARLRLTPRLAWRIVGVLGIVGALVYALNLGLFIKKEFALGEVWRKTSDYVTGVDTNVLANTWRDVDEMIVPAVQADNAVEIPDVTEEGYTHGVYAGGNKLLVKAKDKHSFIRHGQIVYFPKAGRQIIDKVESQGDRQLVTLQSDTVKLDPLKDGAPSRLIVAEDFNHDNTKLWSLYTGVLNEEMGILNSSSGGYDYIIHALGPERREQYVRDFAQQKPQFVLSFTHGYFAWEGWMQNSHWEFYSLLDQNYEVVKESPIYALWKRKDQPWADQHAQPRPWQQLTIVPGSDRIDLPKPSFEGLPDVESYGQQIIAMDRQKMIDMGRRVEQREQVDSAAYAQYLLDRHYDREMEERLRLESNGPETDALQESRQQERRNNDKKAHEDFKKGKKTTSQNPVLHIPRPKRQVVLVRLEYELASPWSFVPVLGKTSRYMVEQNNVYTDTVSSLKPYTNQMTIPIVISEHNQDSYIRLNTYSLLPGKATIKIKKAEWTTLDTSVANLKALTD